MALEPIRATDVDDALADVNPTKAPRGVSQRAWYKGRPPSQSLGWHRGHQAGLHDAFLTVNQRYPRVAKQLREAFGLDEDGSMKFGR